MDRSLEGPVIGIQNNKREYEKLSRTSIIIRVQFVIFVYALNRNDTYETNDRQPGNGPWTPIFGKISIYGSVFETKSVAVAGP